MLLDFEVPKFGFIYLKFLCLSQQKSFGLSCAKLPLFHWSIIYKKKKWKKRNKQTTRNTDCKNFIFLFVSLRTNFLFY